MNYEFVKTTCPFCGLWLSDASGGDGGKKLSRTLPFKGAPMNQGKLCIKGWNAHEFVGSPDRLTAPLVRKNGVLTETSWEEAMETVCFQPIRHSGKARRGTASDFSARPGAGNEVKLSAAEALQGRIRNQQCGSLRQALTRANRGRSCRSIREWRHDQFNSGNRGCGLCPL